MNIYAHALVFLLWDIGLRNGLFNKDFLLIRFMLLAV